MAIEYPIRVTKIEYDKKQSIEPCLFGGKTGDLVSVRPCGEKYKNRTYLGILLGDVALASFARFNSGSGVLTIGHGRHNPAMFVPELSEIIYGCGSWWGRIEDETQLREITDNDIEGVWYVKALKQLEANNSS